MAEVKCYITYTGCVPNNPTPQPAYVIYDPKKEDLMFNQVVSPVTEGEYTYKFYGWIVRYINGKYIAEGTWGKSKNGNPIECEKGCIENKDCVKDFSKGYSITNKKGGVLLQPKHSWIYRYYPRTDNPNYGEWEAHYGGEIYNVPQYSRGGSFFENEMIRRNYAYLLENAKRADAVMATPKPQPKPKPQPEPKPKPKPKNNSSSNSNGNGSRPSGNSNRPNSGGSRPSGNSNRPNSGGSRPSGNSNRPNSGSSRPSGNSNRPNNGGSRPNGNGNRPNSGSSRPSGNSNRPSSGSSRPSGRKPPMWRRAESGKGGGVSLADLGNNPNKNQQQNHKTTAGYKHSLIWVGVALTILLGYKNNRRKTR